ncbi:MAG: glycosyltransferase family 39 protein [Actinomycetota bacterium]|nr:glycosyltransferase family 39 protein [Actinomycetota bacterium]
MLAALAVRVAYALLFSEQDNAPFATGDFNYFHQIANLLASGRGYIRPREFAAMHVMWPSAEHPPLWPFLLAAVSKLGGTSELAHRLAGCPLGAATVAAVGLLGRRVAGERAGLIAAGIAAGYPIFVGADASLMSETLYGLGIAVALLLAYRLLDRPGPAVAVALGAVLGAAALTRPECLLLLALLALPAAVRGGPGWAPRLALTCAATVLVLAPWTIRNWTAFGRPVLVSLNDSTVLRGANCDRAYHGQDAGFWHLGCLTAPRDLRNEARIAEQYRREGLDYALDHAGRLAVVMPVRILRTWDLWQPGRQVLFAEGRNMWVERAGVATYYVLLGLAGFGALRLRRRRDPPLWPLLAPFAMVLVVSLMAYGYTKFRYPAEIPLIVLAAVGVEALLTHAGWGVTSAPGRI